MSICLTCGEQSENHKGMEIIGDGLLDEGLTYQELKKAKKKFMKEGYECKLVNLNKLLLDEDLNDILLERAGVLIVKKGLERLAEEDSDILFSKLADLPWDKKYWDERRGKVLNKIARYNLCFGEKSRKSNYLRKLGTIIGYKFIPEIKKWKDSLEKYLGEKASNLEMEGNFYYDSKKCGIGYHGDSERKVVIGGSLGDTRPLCFQWYYKGSRVGKKVRLNIENGDMYIMSGKASGFDWKKSSIYTLRHAAGERFI